MLRELVTILNQPLQAGWHYVKTARQFVFPLGMDYLQTLDELFHFAVGFADHRPVTIRPYDWTVLEVSGVYAGRTGVVNLAGIGCVTTVAVDSAVAARKVAARIARNVYHTT